MLLSLLALPSHHGIFSDGMEAHSVLVDFNFAACKPSLIQVLFRQQSLFELAQAALNFNVEGLADVAVGENW